MENTTGNTPIYTEFQNVFEGLAITLRHYVAGDKVYIKLDDNFARANGFRTMAELYKLAPSLKGSDWLDVKLLEQAEEFSKTVN